MPKEPEQFLEIYEKNENKNKASPWLDWEIQEVKNYWLEECRVGVHGLQKIGKTQLVFNIKNDLNLSLIVINCGHITESNVYNLIDVPKYIKNQRIKDGLEPIVFIDEPDLAASNRSLLPGKIYPVINTSIGLITRIAKEGERIIAATNAPYNVDPTVWGLFRPGILFLPIPNSAERKSIIKRFLQSEDFGKGLAPKIVLSESDLDKLVEKTALSPTGPLIGVLNVIRVKEIKNIDDILNKLRETPIVYSQTEINLYRTNNEDLLEGETNFPYRK